MTRASNNSVSIDDLKSSLLSLLQKGHFQQAEKEALKFLSSGQSNFYAWFVAGICAAQLGRNLEAIQRFEQAANISRSCAAAIEAESGFQLGLMLSQAYLATGQKKAADQLIVGTLQRYGVFPQFCNDTGNVLAQCERFDEAMRCYRHAIDADCDRVQALNNLANVLVMSGRSKDAIEYYKSALEENSGADDTTSNLASALDLVGEFDEAGELHRRAVSGSPDNIKFNMNYAMHLLRCRRIVEAIPHYLYRFQSSAWGRELDALKQIAPPHKAGKFQAGTVVAGEQGLGDEIYLLKLLAGLDRPEHWSYVGDGRLNDLFTRTFTEASFVARSAENVDALIQNASNAWRLDHVLMFTETQCKPDGSAMLMPDGRMVKQWKMALDAINRSPKIGISWTGGQRRMDRLRREVAPHNWSDLACNRDYTFIDIQYDDRPSERRLIEKCLKGPIHRLDGFDLINDLDNSAAVLPALDHVITVDNSTAHLAGVLGVNACVLLGRIPDWRWGMSDSGSDVYPSLKLFRQTRPNDWHDPLGQIANDLDAAGDNG